MSGFAERDDAALTQGIIPRRVLSSLIDGLIMGVLLGILHSALWVLGYLTFGLGWFLAGGLWVVPIFYVFAFVASPGQGTFGQALCGLRVARNDDLGRPTPAQALIYAAAYALTLWLGALLLVVALFTRRVRCLHDIASGLVVVRADALVPAMMRDWTVMDGSFGK